VTSVGQLSPSLNATAAGQLGEDDFFNLLATQLRNQDPLKPLENTEYVSQLAEFSSLEAVKSLSAAFAQFTQGQAIAQASALLGRLVEGLHPETGQTVSGLVTAVRAHSGTVMVQMGNVEIPLTSITQVG
jgi:flagellar basal-body rod modification protein FlgD